MDVGNLLSTVLTCQLGSFLPTRPAWDRAPVGAVTCPAPGVYFNSCRDVWITYDGGRNILEKVKVIHQKL